MMLRTALIALGLWSLASLPLRAASCEDVTYNDNSFALCTVDLGREDLRLFLNAKDGTPYQHFSAIDRALRDEGKALEFAMNAGMYHEDRSPVGHYIENGVQQMRVIPNAGPGNFGLLPNGVFCLRKGRADVIETRRYQREAPDCLYATQSGPMLVIDGALHPKFLATGTSRYIRNGVGTSADGRIAQFVISNNVVNFHDFASFFRDYLGLDQALFFDGNVSRLRAPDLGRDDLGRRLGPIVGTVVDSD